jgi:WD40 repeat protein
MYDAFTGAAVDSMQASTLYFGFAASLDFVPDGSSLVASFIDPRLYPVGFMRTFDSASFEEEHKLPGLWQVGMDVSPDGTLAVSAGPGGVTIFDLATGEAVDAILGTGEGQGRVVAFSPAGSLLAFQDTSGHIDVFEFATRTHLASFAHPMPADLGVGSIEFSPDGTLLLTAGADGAVRLWEPGTGTEVRSLTGHLGPVNAAHFSPDGTTVVTGGSDGTVRLWDTATGAEALIMRTAGPSVGSLAFSSDGTRLAVIDADRRVQMYAIDLDDLLNLADQRLTRSLTDEECLTFLQQETCPEGD